MAAPELWKQQTAERERPAVGEDSAAYELVTAAQVLAVARDVFKPQQRTVGVLEPQPAAGH